MNKRASDQRMKKLTEAICSVVDDYMMVSFILLDLADEDTMNEVMAFTDHAIQFGENAEPRAPLDIEDTEELADGAGF
eukprot:gene9623-12350_t